MGSKNQPKKVSSSNLSRRPFFSGGAYSQIWSNITPYYPETIVQHPESLYVVPHVVLHSRTYCADPESLYTV